MKSRILAATVPTLLFLWSSGPALALDGEPYIHDPSTVIAVRWQVLHFRHRRRRPDLRRRLDLAQRRRAFRAGAAPDIIHIGDRYYMAYASSGGGLGGGHASTIHVMWSKTLDPNSPDYRME